MLDDSLRSHEASTDCPKCSEKGKERRGWSDPPPELVLSVPRAGRKDDQLFFLKHNVTPSEYISWGSSVYKPMSFVCHNGDFNRGHVVTVKVMEDGQMVHVDHVNISPPTAVTSEMCSNSLIFHYARISDDAEYV